MYYINSTEIEIQRFLKEGLIVSNYVGEILFLSCPGLVWSALVSRLLIKNISRVRKLRPAQPQYGECSITDILSCGDEINRKKSLSVCQPRVSLAIISEAWEDCQHLGSSDEIIKCITDILQGTPHCKDCICDVLGFLC